MTDVTRILNAIEGGDEKATDQLLPLVYEELRLLAAQKLSHESPGQTLQATSLVHEAYIRLTGSNHQNWDGHGHFFAAAAEAMRRILIDRARRKQSPKGGEWHKVGLEWDGEYRHLYLDDTEVAMDDRGLLDLEGTGYLNIGTGKAFETGTFWSGLIDDVRVYKKGSD